MCTARSIYALRLLCVAAAVAVGSALVPAHAQNATGSVATATYGLPDFADLVEKVSPAVVNIRTTEKVRMQQGGPNDDDMAEFFRRFFGVPMPGMPGQGQKRRNAPPQQEEEQSRGVGSGFIISGDGYILTNAHVVEGAETIYVTLIDKREYKAKLIGLDKRTDVALVKVEASALPSLKLGDSDKVRVGEWVLAIGSPFGLDNTVTAGIVSAKGRDTGDYLPFIQSDVAVNPGNSGGPLINLRGEVIGINNQIYSQSGGYMGISFSIPIDEAMRVAEQLKATGRVTRGRIGVAIDNVPKDAAESLGLGRARGAYVGNVESGGPADKAGIEAGDIVLKYNGRDVEKAGDLQRQVGETKPGTRATVQVWRKGATRDLAVTVAELQADTKVAQRTKGAQPDNSQQGPGKPNALGLVVADLSDGARREFKTKSGVEVQVSEGPAARVGIRPGDLILRVGYTDVTNAKQFNEVVAKLDKNRMVAVFVRRGDATQVVTLRPSAARSGGGQ
jgi:serine protease Do